MNLMYRTTKWQQRSPGVALRGFLGDACVGAGSFNWPCNADANVSEELKQWPELMFVQSNYGPPDSNKGQLFTPEGREWFKTSYGRYPDPKFNAPPYTIPPDSGDTTYLTSAQILAAVSMTVDGSGNLVPGASGSGSGTPTPSGSGSGSGAVVNAPIIAGVDNTILYAGAAGLLVILMLVMGK